MLKNKTWFRVHSFTGVVTGLLLFVICWGGTFAVISHELDWLMTPEAKIEVAPTKSIDWEFLSRQVKQAYPESDLVWLEAPHYAKSAVQFVVNMPDQDFVRIYLDPGSGEVLGEWSYFNVQRFFRSFHMNLFIPNRVGSYIVMVFAVTLLVSLVAGLCFYKRWWQRFFRFKRGKSIFFSELHKTAGLWSIWFVLIIALTGVWYLFEQLRGHIGDGVINYAGNPDYSQHAIAPPTSDSSLLPLGLNKLIAIAKRERADIAIKTISFDRDETGGYHTLYIDGQSDHLLVRDRANQMRLDVRTGEVIYNQSPEDYSAYWRLSDTADPLHFGDFAGLWSKAIWFVFGLLLSGVILTGTWLHAKRLALEIDGRIRHRWPGTLPAMLISVVVLVASVPYGLIQAADFYGSTVAGTKQLPNLAPGVAAVIILWVFLTVSIIGLWLYLLRQALVVGVVNPTGSWPGSRTAQSN